MNFVSSNVKHINNWRNLASVAHLGDIAKTIIMLYIIFLNNYFNRGHNEKMAVPTPASVEYNAKAISLKHLWGDFVKPNT